MMLGKVREGVLSRMIYEAVQEQREVKICRSVGQIFAFSETGELR